MSHCGLTESRRKTLGLEVDGKRERIYKRRQRLHFVIDMTKIFNLAIHKEFKFMANPNHFPSASTLRQRKKEEDGQFSIGCLSAEEDERMMRMMMIRKSKREM